MPVCCIVECGSRKNVNQPRLSVHRFPKNEGLRKKWLEAIGEGNINPRHKEWYICSRHFEENCFNKTLDVMRLYDNSIPTIFPVSSKKHRKLSVKNKSNASCNSTLVDPLELPHEFLETVHKESNIKKHEELPVRKISSITIVDPLQIPRRIFQTVHKEAVHTEKMRVLKNKYVNQQRIIKCLKENIRKKNKTITNLRDIIKDLRKKCMNVEQAVVIKDLVLPKDFFKGKLKNPKVYQINTVRKFESSHQR